MMTQRAFSRNAASACTLGPRKQRCSRKYLATKNNTVFRIWDVYSGSWMFIPDPDFRPFRIPDPKTAKKERGKNKLSFLFVKQQKSQN
jgi:hypothetical protein